MRRFLSLIVPLAALAAFATANVRAEEKEKPKSSPLEMIKKLAGDWTGTGKHGDQEHPANFTYRLTAGGSAVIETIGPGSMHEMVTMYHLDGGDLVLTHYCMLQNQPRMKAKKDSGAHKLVFQFAGGTNIDADKDAHMHDMTMEFVSDDHIKTTWTLYKDGKATQSATFDLKRKKK